MQPIPSESGQLTFILSVTPSRTPVLGHDAGPRRTGGDAPARLDARGKTNCLLHGEGVPGRDRDLLPGSKKTDGLDGGGGAASSERAAQR